MTTDITLLQFEALQKIFDYFNQELFGGQLNQCLLNLSRLSRARGFFAPERWVGTGDGEVIHEISLNPEHMARKPEEVLGTFVHEMVHLWQQDFGNPSPGYHNKEWAAKMKEVGLYPSHTGQEGGKETGKNCSHYILPDGAYKMSYDAMPKEYLYPFTYKPVMKIVKPNKNKTKFTCPGCENNVWGKADISVKCADCDEYFEKQD